MKSLSRLRLASDFAYVREHGSKFPGRLLVLVTAPARGELRAGVVCGRKFSPLAVKRNRARRLLWESFRLLRPWIKPCEVIMIPRFPIRNAKMQEVRAELRGLMIRAGVFSGDSQTGETPCTGFPV